MGMKILFGLVLLLLYITVGPVLLIWSLNNLFNLNILYTFNNWLSCYILMAILSVIVGKDKIIIDKYSNEKDDIKRPESDS